MKITNIEDLRRKKMFKTKCYCGAELEFEEKDIFDEKHTLFLSIDGECTKSKYVRRYVICPNCGEVVHEDKYGFERLGD